jgi:transposase
MKPISLDVRRLVFAAVQEGELTRTEIAERFGVCKSWIRRLLQRFREAGSIAALPHGGGRPPILEEADLERLRKLSAENSDATLNELLDLLGEPVCQMTICRALKKLRLPLKKSRTMPASRIGPTSRVSESNIERPCSDSTRDGSSTSTNRRPARR